MQLRLLLLLFQTRPGLPVCVSRAWERPGVVLLCRQEKGLKNVTKAAPNDSFPSVMEGHICFLGLSR